MKVVNARGVTIPGLGTRQGRRKYLGLPPLPRGGKQIKKTTHDGKWVHPDAREALSQIVFKKYDEEN